MRSSIIVASLALFSYAAAQGVEGLPTCAQKCLEPFASAEGIAGCGVIDIGCICSSGGFLNNIGCCLIAECSEADQQAAIAFAANICKSAGVTVPSEIECDSASSTTSIDTEALSSTLSSAISSATSVISELISSRSESSESLASTLSSASSAATASDSTTATTGRVRGTSAVSSAASAASSAATSAAGATGYVAVAGSGIVGGIIAALALL